MNFLFIQSFLAKKSYLFKIFLLIFKQVPVFVWALSYYTALFFVNSNLSFFVITVFFFLVLYTLSKDLRQAMFLVFVVSMPFVNGKTFDMILIPKKLIPHFGIYDVGYYFPVYPSVIFLAGTLYLIFRQRKNIAVSKHLRMVIIGFGLFLFVASLSIFNSPYPLVVGLSIIQLIILGSIYLLPYWLRLSKSTMSYVSQILSAFVMFEGVWVVLQALNNGPLGRYIEATLGLNRTGIFSTEDKSFMRFNGTFYEPSILGTFMLMHAFYFGFLLIQKRGNFYEKILYSLSVFSALVSIILTGSRGIYGLLVVMLFIVFRFYLINIMRKIIMKRVTRIIILTCLALSFFLYPHIMKRAETLPTLFDKEGSGTFRLSLNSYAFRLATIHVFGVGLNLSPYFFAYGFPEERTVDPSHPHNIFFQILGETGFPGLLAFLIFLRFIYWKYMVKRTPRSDPHFIASILFLLSAQFYPIFVSQPEIFSFFFLHAGLMNWTQKGVIHERK